MCDELKVSCGAINIMLDDKKCATMKSTIETIRNKLEIALKLSPMEAMLEGSQVTDRANVKKLEEISSSEDEEEQFQPRPSSQFVSSLHDPSFNFGSSSQQMQVDTLEPEFAKSSQPNEITQRADVPDRMDGVASVKHSQTIPLPKGPRHSSKAYLDGYTKEPEKIIQTRR